MDKSYEPHAIESRWYAFWEANGHFRPDLAQTAEPPYCIMIPPPNVTGSLHMGHAFQDTLMDVLTRYHRMHGAPRCGSRAPTMPASPPRWWWSGNWPRRGRSRHDLGREAFVERVWEWKAESGGTITRQLRRMGASCDWSRERFTMDEGLSAAVHRGVRAPARGRPDLSRQAAGELGPGAAHRHFRSGSGERGGKGLAVAHPLSAGRRWPTTDAYLVVATTRPETLLGDTAVAVHPDDERYRHLIGQQVRLPLAERLIPIIADDYVDPEFGTGCVKITPAHDFNDYAVGQRHNLPLINIFTIDATHQ